LQQRPDNEWINDRIHLVDDQTAPAPLLQRIEKKQAGKEEEQRHVEAIDDAVHKHEFTLIHGQPCIEDAPRDMPVDNENDSDRLGIINPNVSLLHCLFSLYFGQ